MAMTCSRALSGDVHSLGFHEKVHTLGNGDQLYPDIADSETVQKRMMGIKHLSPFLRPGNEIEPLPRIHDINMAARVQRAPIQTSGGANDLIGLKAPLLFDGLKQQTPSGKDDLLVHASGSSSSSARTRGVPPNWKRKQTRPTFQTELSQGYSVGAPSACMLQRSVAAEDFLRTKTSSALCRNPANLLPVDGSMKGDNSTSKEQVCCAEKNEKPFKKVFCPLMTAIRNEESHLLPGEKNVGKADNSKVMAPGTLNCKRVAVPSLESLSSDSGDEGKACLLCGTTKTPLWRNGPPGPKTLCNACGIRFNKIRTGKRNPTAAEAAILSRCHSSLPQLSVPLGQMAPVSHPSKSLGAVGFRPVSPFIAKDFRPSSLVSGQDLLHSMNASGGKRKLCKVFAVYPASKVLCSSPSSVAKYRLDCNQAFRPVLQSGSRGNDVSSEAKVVHSDRSLQPAGMCLPLGPVEFSIKVPTKDSSPHVPSVQKQIPLPSSEDETFLHSANNTNIVQSHPEVDIPLSDVEAAARLLMGLTEGY